MLPTSPLSKSFSGLYSLHLHHHLPYPGPFNLFSRPQPKRTFKMQISSGYFSAQNPLGISYYSKDQVQTLTSDPHSSSSTKACLPREPGFQITPSMQAPCPTFGFLNPLRALTANSLYTECFPSLYSNFFFWACIQLASTVLSLAVFTSIKSLPDFPIPD